MCCVRSVPALVAGLTGSSEAEQGEMVLMELLQQAEDGSSGLRPTRIHTSN